MKALKAVYTYAFPEVESIMLKTFPAWFWKVTTPAKAVQLLLEAYHIHIDVPRTKDGYVDLDEIHNPICSAIEAVYAELIIGANNFNWYPTSGSSEGIFKVLGELQAKGHKLINVFEGEYEGFQVYAEALGMSVNFVPRDVTDEALLIIAKNNGTWFISNPSAIDGNFVDNELLQRVNRTGNKIALDLAYVGMTRYHKFYVSTNVDYVFLSLSKPYGVFRHRIGFTLTRTPSQVLYGNKWFKDITRLFQAYLLATEIGPLKLYEKYVSWQQEAISTIIEEDRVVLKPSDVFLLAHAEHNSFTDYKRGTSFRFCLTPYFEDIEKNH